MLEIYYFRWRMYRKRLKETSDGYVVEEFPFPVFWAGKWNTISAPAGHHICEGRWLRNQEYMNDYSRFWFQRGGGPKPRQYSFWAADSIYNRYLVNVDVGLVEELLQQLIYNYRLWEDVQQGTNSLFWQYDLRDGMEFQVSGSGYRPSINAYMYGDAMAIRRMADILGCDELAENYDKRATDVKRLVQERLWGERDEFFKTLPQFRFPGDPRSDAKPADVREEIGYIPWYFNLPDSGYENAWKQLMDPAGFYAPYGPTTCERRDPGFNPVSYCCRWDGTSWPYATTQTLVALANLLNNYGRQGPGRGPKDERLPVDEQDYFDLLRIYTKTHHKLRNGERIPWIGESVNPFTGDWTTATENYNHSGYCDLVISGLVGLRPRPDEVVEINPLVPDKQWDYFALDRVLYHGYELSVRYDRDGRHYGKGQGLRVFADGREIARAGGLTRLTARLPGRTDESAKAAVCPEDAVAPGSRVIRTTTTASYTFGIDNVTHPTDGVISYDESPHNRWTAFGSGLLSDWWQITFPNESACAELILYFYDDGGGVQAPEGYDVRYWDGDGWISAPNQVRSPSPPRVGRNRVTFDAIMTDRIRIVFDNKGGGPYGDGFPGLTEVRWSA